MPDLRDQFEALVDAATESRFEEVLSSSALAGQPARHHPLNFIAIRIDDGAGLTLRLHLWDDRFAFGQAGFEVHDHVFDFESYIVNGAVQQTLYEIDPDEQGSLSAYEVHYEENAALMRPVNDHIRLRETRVDQLAAGMRYALAPGILHRLEPLTPTATTLVLTRTHAGRPITFGPPERLLTPRTERSPIIDSSGRPMTITEDGLGAISAAARDHAAA